VTKLNAFFFNSLFHWMAAYVCFHILVSVIFFLQKKKKILFLIVFLLYTSCELGCALFNEIRLLTKNFIDNSDKFGNIEVSNVV
jgi:hypothetical protein